MADIRAQSLVTSERASLADDFISFGPDAPTILPGWGAQDLLEHLIVREQRPDLALGVLVPVHAISDWAEAERAKLRELDWAEQVERFRSGPPRFSPVRGIDRLMNTGEYVVHHEDLLRARPGWSPRDLGEPAERELWGSVRHMGRGLIHAEADITLVSPLGGVRVPSKRSHGAVRVTGKPSELLLWSFGRDRVARVDVQGEPAAITALNAGRRGV